MQHTVNLIIPWYKRALCQMAEYYDIKDSQIAGLNNIEVVVK